MNRRTPLAALAAMMALVIVSIIGGARASAQPISWCPSGCYTVDLSSVPTSCFPLCIYTSWGGGTLTWPSTAAPCYATPAVFTECPVPALPVGTPLDWVNRANAQRKHC